MGQQPNDDRHMPTESTSRPLAVLLAVSAGLVRLIPHPWNMAPIGAVGLFSGARLGGWLALALPLLIRAATDVAKLKIDGLTIKEPLMYFAFVGPTYLSLAISVWMGKYLRGTESPWRIGGLAVASSLQFFFITNFGSWLMSPLSSSPDYPFTLQGLALCFAAGVPFYPWTLLGDLLYTCALFGLLAWLARAQLTTEPVSVAAK